MIRIFILAVTFAVSLASSGMSETLVLTCNMTQIARSGGWIPRAAVIKVDTATKRVELVKPTAKQLNGRIRSQKLVRNDAKKMILRWAISNTQSKSLQVATTFNFRLSVAKPSGKASVIAKPEGFSNDFRAAGICDFC